MIKLNTKNGHFQFGDQILNPDSGSTVIKTFSQKDGAEIWLENKEWITYRINGFDPVILMFTFLKNDIYTIEVYIKDDNKKDKLKTILDGLGGVNQYTWGTVSLNFDHKAGYESLLISYQGT